MLRDLAKIRHKLDPKDGSCCAIVETPKGRRGKLDYDPKTDTFLAKVSADCPRRQAGRYHDWCGARVVLK